MRVKNQDIRQHTGRFPWSDKIGIVFLVLSCLATAKTAAAAAPVQFVSVSGTHLALADKIFVPKGINHMDVPTLWNASSTMPGNTWITDKDFAAFEAAGFNSVRLAVKTDYFQSPAPPHRFSESGFAWLDNIVRMAKRHKIKIILDMHMPTGGQYQDYRVRPESSAFWNDPWMKGRFVDVWREIARREANEPAIWAYDLMNEPATWDFESFERLMRHTQQAIRTYDARHVILLQAGMSMSQDYVASFRYPLIDDANSAYTIHFYDPVEFTHKDVWWGVNGKNVIPVYPSNSTSTDAWNAQRIQTSYLAAIDRTGDAKRPVVMTEFGSVFQGKDSGQNQWIKDAIAAADKMQTGWHYWYYKGQTCEHELCLARKTGQPRPNPWKTLSLSAKKP